MTLFKETFGLFQRILSAFSKNLVSPFKESSHPFQGAFQSLQGLWGPLRGDSQSLQGIFSMRRMWRPPSKGVAKNSSMMPSASLSERKRPGITSTLASLC